MLRERQDGGIRVNVRTSGVFDASAFARSFGGGGHARASGFTIDAPLPVAEAIILAAAAQLLSCPARDLPAPDRAAGRT